MILFIFLVTAVITFCVIINGIHNHRHQQYMDSAYQEELDYWGEWDEDADFL